MHTPMLLLCTFFLSLIFFFFNAKSKDFILMVLNLLNFWSQVMQTFGSLIQLKNNHIKKKCEGCLNIFQDNCEDIVLHNVYILNADTNSYSYNKSFKNYRICKYFYIMRSSANSINLKQLYKTLNNWLSRISQNIHLLHVNRILLCFQNLN